jgi:serine/threonine-protein kinase RIO1
VIGKLGSGTASNVWHALDSNGNEVAIKMYMKTTDDEGQMLTAKDFVTQAEEAVEKEVKRLKASIHSW